MKSYSAPAVSEAGVAADVVQVCKNNTVSDNSGNTPPSMYPPCTVVDLDD